MLDFELKPDGTYRVSLNASSKEKNITIPKKHDKKDVTEISGFRNNEYLETVKFYGNISKIDDGTFSYCSNLKSITVENSKYYSSTNGMLHQGNTLLVYPSGKESSSITIEKNISPKAFAVTTNLKNVTIKSSIVNENAFYYSDSIKEITICGEVNSVNDKFFSGFELERLIINNERIASTLDVNNVTELYVTEYQVLSTNTQMKYKKVNVDKIGDVVYDVYKLK